MFWGRLRELAERVEMYFKFFCDFRDDLNERFRLKLSRDEVKTCEDCGCLVHVNAAIEIEPKVEKTWKPSGFLFGPSSILDKYEVKTRHLCKRCMADRADKELAKVIQKAAREYREALFPDVPPPTTDKFRAEIAAQVRRLRRDSNQFRLAERFGLVEAKENPVIFWFEQQVDIVR